MRFLQTKIKWVALALVIALLLGVFTGMKLRGVRLNGFSMENPALEFITDFRNKNYSACDSLSDKDERILTTKSFYLTDDRFKQYILEALSNSITDVKVNNIDNKTGVVSLNITYKTFEKLPSELDTSGISIKDIYNNYIMGKATVDETDKAISGLYYKLFEKNCLVTTDKTQSMDIELEVKTAENGKQVVVGATQFVNSIMSSSGMLANLNQYDEQSVGVLQYLVDTVED